MWTTELLGKERIIITTPVTTQIFWFWSLVRICTIFTGIHKKYCLLLFVIDASDKRFFSSLMNWAITFRVSLIRLPPSVIGLGEGGKGVTNCTASARSKTWACPRSVCSKITHIEKSVCNSGIDFLLPQFVEILLCYGWRCIMHCAQCMCWADISVSHCMTRRRGESARSHRGFLQAFEVHGVCDDVELSAFAHFRCPVSRRVPQRQLGRRLPVDEGVLGPGRCRVDRPRVRWRHPHNRGRVGEGHVWPVVPPQHQLRDRELPLDRLLQVSDWQDPHLRVALPHWRPRAKARPYVVMDGRPGSPLILQRLPRGQVRVRWGSRRFRE